MKTGLFLRFISAIVISVLAAAGAVPPALAAASRASAVLTAETAVESGMTVSMGSAADVHLQTAGGQNGWELTCSSVDPNRKNDDSAYLFGKVTDEALSDLGNGQTVIMKITYYDDDQSAKGNKGFYVGYHSTKKAEDIGGVIALGSTKTWKTATLILKNARFSKGLDNKWDFALRTYGDYMTMSKVPVLIQKIELEKGAVSPLDITISSDKLGNIFGDTKKPVLRGILTNVTEKDATFTVSYTVTDSTQSVVYEKSHDVFIPAGGISYDPLALPSLNYGLYDVTVEATEASGLASSGIGAFSVVNEAGTLIHNASFGAHVHLTREGRDISGQMELMGRAGFGYVRIDEAWANIEQEAGVYEIPAKFDRIVTEAHKNGMEPMVILGNYNYYVYPDYPPFTITDGSVSAEEAEALFNNYLQVFKNYVTATVKFFGDRVNCYEIYNEYNLNDVRTYFNDYGINNDPEDYAKILQAGYEAVKAANPDAIVVGGALANMDSSGQQVSVSYIEQLYAAGAGNYMDVLSLHPYQIDGPEKDFRYGTNYTERIPQILEIIENYGGKQELWSTEYGWYLSPRYGITGENVAELAVRTELFSRAHGLFDKSFWYCFDGSAYTDYEWNIDYGLIGSGKNNTPFAAKPVYLALANFNKLLAGAECKELKVTNENAYVYRFGKRFSDAPLYALYTLSGTEKVSIDMEGATDIVLYDIYGNESELHSDTGVFELTAGTSPVFAGLPGEAPQVDYNVSKIMIEGTLDTQKETKLSVVVLRPGKTYADYQTDPLGSLQYLDQCTTNAKGEYQFASKVNQGEGTYTVLLCPETGGSPTALEVMYSPIALSVVQKSVELTELAAYDKTGVLDVSAQFKATKKVPETALLVCAFYNGNKLVRIEKLEEAVSLTDFALNLPVGAYTKDEPIDTIKVMLFSGIRELKPLTVQLVID